MRIQDGLAFFLLWLQLPIPLFWLVVHPAIRFWRRHPRACYTGLAPAVWLVSGAALLVPYAWWLGERFTRSPWVALAGLVLVAVDAWLLRQVEQHMGWRALVGLPELQPGTVPDVVPGGIYERLRHPRYAGMVLTWWGAVLLTGATRLLVLVAVLTVLALAVTELEERELLERLGPAYADYRRRVPRFLPWGKGTAREPEEGRP